MSRYLSWWYTYWVTSCGNVMIRQCSHTQKSFEQASPIMCLFHCLHSKVHQIVVHYHTYSHLSCWDFHHSLYITAAQCLLLACYSLFHNSSITGEVSRTVSPLTGVEVKSKVVYLFQLVDIHIPRVQRMLVEVVQRNKPHHHNGVNYLGFHNIIVLLLFFSQFEPYGESFTS